MKGDKDEKGRKEERPAALWGASVCYRAGSGDICCSLHLPASHHRDSSLNHFLICNTTIPAYKPGYVTVRAKS